MSMDVVAGGQVLHFKEATIGPHAMIAGHKVSQDGARVFVTAADADTFWFKCSDGRKVSFGGTPGEILISPDGKNAAVEVQGSLGMRQMQDLSKLPPDKLAAALKDMEKKFVYTIDGKKHGPFDDIDQVWYPRTSSDLYFEVKGQLFRNGTAVAGLKSVNRCDLPEPGRPVGAIAGYEAEEVQRRQGYPRPGSGRLPGQGKTVFSDHAGEGKGRSPSTSVRCRSGARPGPPVLAAFLVPMTARAGTPGPSGTDYPRCSAGATPTPALPP